MKKIWNKKFKFAVTHKKFNYAQNGDGQLKKILILQQGKYIHVLIKKYTIGKKLRCKNSYRKKKKIL